MFAKHGRYLECGYQVTSQGLYEGNKIELSTVRLPVETATRLTPVARLGPPLKDNGELFRNEIVQFAEA